VDFLWKVCMCVFFFCVSGVRFHCKVLDFFEKVWDLSERCKFCLKGVICSWKVKIFFGIIYICLATICIFCNGFMISFEKKFSGKGMDLLWKVCIFNERYWISLNGVDFLWRGMDFLWKKCGYFLKKCEFPLTNVDFLWESVDSLFFFFNLNFRFV